MILNPRTNRMVKVGGSAYRRMVREGLVSVQAKAAVPELEPEPEPVPEPEPEPKPESESDQEESILAVEKEQAKELERKKEKRTKKKKQRKKRKYSKVSSNYEVADDIVKKNMEALDLDEDSKDEICERLRCVIMKALGE